MLYTLGIVFVWFVLAFVLGTVVGWFVHRVVRRSSAPHSPKASAPLNEASGDAAKSSASMQALRAELKELKSRVVALEPVEFERDRLRRELAELRAIRASELKIAVSKPIQTPPPPDDVSTLRNERDQLRALLGRHEATIGIQAATIDRLQSHVDSESQAAPRPPDLEIGRSMLGTAIQLDDLTVVVGIDTDIAALCHQHEITTWWGLANTDVRVLRSMLEAAGRSATQYDPSSWPQQARLLAHGSWQQFVNLTNRLPRLR
jgi:predicted flap endonuclease-1-like 5' DNA nuclease